MKLLREHLFILEEMRNLYRAANVAMVRKSLGLRPNISDTEREFYDERRIFTILDLLQTMGLIDGIWPVMTGGSAIWTLTCNGLRCLDEQKHL